ncbi:hypothetical protein ACQQ2N_05795 [Dokdonella sp. MW10]|uniref:hypothetical protein n=1 Tax=Dokdonella sp. MW10 TaxID=2992926 RepID=UPI003F7E6134
MTHGDPRVDRLIDVLGSAASYNDKGYAWSGHSASQQDAMRATWQAELLVLAEALGDDALGKELVKAIRSGVAVRDGSGDVVQLARRRFGRQP